MEDLVECRSESSYPEQPVALVWEGRRLEVESIVSRWRSPQAIGFRVRTAGSLVFELEYNTATDVWRITPV